MALQLGQRGYLGPHWADATTDGLVTQHPAYIGSPVGDAEQLGVARLGRGMGRAAARMFNQTVNATFRILGAWTDNSCATINIELGRPGRTLNSAAVHVPAIWVSTDNGVNWTRGNGTNFTAALGGPNNTRLVVTAGSGVAATWEAARVAGNLRVDYVRRWPFSPAETLPDTNDTPNIPRFDGLIYDAGTWRGRPTGGGAGNVLSGTNRTGAGIAGVPVVLKGAFKLVTFERMNGVRSVTIRMRLASDNSILATRTLNITTDDGYTPPAPLATGAFLVGAEGVDFGGTAS